MINLDQYILAFVGQNWLTMSVALALLKAIALMTPGTKDDKIHTLLSNLFYQIRGKTPPNERYPAHDERGVKLD